MPDTWIRLALFVAAYFAVTVALVAPLYILVIRRLGDDAAAAESRSNLESEIADVKQSQDDIAEKLNDIHNTVEMNAERSQRNQRHIHQLLVGEHNATEDGEIGNPHYTAEYCPLGDECTFHNPDGAD